MVGPAPPEAAAEANATGGDERIAQVVRILAVLAAADREPSTANAAAPEAGTDVSASLKADAYDVMGAPADAANAVIKKQYWKLSLMIHPDKCRHPKAAEAFQALAAAAKLLQVRVQQALAVHRCFARRIV